MRSTHRSAFPAHRITEGLDEITNPIVESVNQHMQHRVLVLESGVKRADRALRSTHDIRHGDLFKGRIGEKVPRGFNETFERRLASCLAGGSYPVVISHYCSLDGRKGPQRL